MSETGSSVSVSRNCDLAERKWPRTFHDEAEFTCDAHHAKAITGCLGGDEGHLISMVIERSYFSFIHRLPSHSCTQISRWPTRPET